MGSNDPSHLPNHKIVVIAAYLAGASGGYVDTEDIAVQAWKLAPDKFCWKKYPEQINIEVVRRRLTEAASHERGALVVGSQKDGWLLSEAGIALSKEFSEKVPKLSEGDVFKVTKENPWIKRERARMQSEAAYLKWKAGNSKEITAIEAERFFRIDDYVVGDLRAKRISRAVDAFLNDQELSKAIDFIRGKVRERS